MLDEKTLIEESKKFPIIYSKVWGSSWIPFSNNLIPKGHVAFSRFECSVLPKDDLWDGSTLEIDVEGIVITHTNFKVRFDFIDGSFYKGVVINDEEQEKENG